jgi:hypothetical protein
LIDLNFKIEFDYDIDLVKTTGDEEGGANGYTRQNYIVLNDNALTTSDDNLAQLISHELFHIVCRNDETLRKEMYAIIGFEIGNVVPVPDQLKDLRMTNPDAVAWDSFITLTDDEENVAEYLMITYSNEPYTTGTFFSYLNVGFLKVTGTGTRVADLENGEPIIRVYEDFSDFYDQVGNNTNYTVHPEEILADNFALIIMSATGIPSAWLPDEMKSRLSQ